MATERPVPEGFGMRLEPQSSRRAQTSWDRAAIDSVITNLHPVFEQLRPIAVYLRLGADPDHEPSSLSPHRRRGSKRLPDPEVLHMITFTHADGDLDDEFKIYDAADNWNSTVAKGGQRLSAHIFDIPLPTSMVKEPVDTLEKALDFLLITPEDHEQIYPPRVAEAPKT